MKAHRCCSDRDTASECGQEVSFDLDRFFGGHATSRSMHGLPERVAKALVLEALCTAHAERRPCFLYAYSGPEDIIEHALDLAPGGIGRLLDFLGFSFWGGNDETGVMLRVVARLE